MEQRPIVVPMNEPFALIRKAADLLEELGDGKLMTTDDCCEILATVHAARDVLTHAHDDLVSQLKEHGVEFSGGYYTDGLEPMPEITVKRHTPLGEQH